LDELSMSKDAFSRSIHPIGAQLQSESLLALDGRHSLQDGAERDLCCCRRVAHPAWRSGEPRNVASRCRQNADPEFVKKVADTVGDLSLAQSLPARQYGGSGKLPVRILSGALVEEPQKALEVAGEGRGRRPSFERSPRMSVIARLG
jgi:hypothetical protein